MQHYTKVAKILISLYVLGNLLWLGGSIIRTSIAFEIFVAGTELKLKTEYTDVVKLHNVKLYAYSALYTDFGFSLTLVSAIMLMIYLRKSIKKQGWLFMAFALLVIAVPYEFYQMYLDIKLNYVFNNSPPLLFSDKSITDFFIVRFTKLSIWGALSFLTAITSIIIIVWRPLDKVNTKGEIK